MGYAKHFRFEHGNDELAHKQSHINGLEPFWAYAKLRLAKLKGIREKMLYYHWKEIELRFNHHRDSLYLALL